MTVRRAGQAPAPPPTNPSNAGGCTAFATPMYGREARVPGASDTQGHFRQTRAASIARPGCCVGTCPTPPSNHLGLEVLPTMPPQSVPAAWERPATVLLRRRLPTSAAAYPATAR